MNIEVLDTENLLSKTQKGKIKENYKKEMDVSTILSSIHYPENVKKKYEIINVINVKDDFIKLELKYDERKTLLQDKLRNKLGYLKHKKREDWVMYEKLRGTFKEMIPTPTDVVKNKSVYEPILEKYNNKNPIYKYIQLCFENA